jgi:hypothetical protein
MDERSAAEIELATRNLLALIERHLPTLLESFTLVGSAADGDYRAGHSDLDFVAVLKSRATEDELDGLTILHRLYGGDPTLPKLDGIWVTPDELESGPDVLGAGPTSIRGTFLADATGNRNPITWFTLREIGRTILGTLDRRAVWQDPARLREWVRSNVESYWDAVWLAEARRLGSSRGLGLLRGRNVAWGVLGISRMHHTLATSGIVSKSEAGRYALTVFDAQWHPLIEEALGIRAGGHTHRKRENPFTRRKATLNFVAMAIEAIRRDY